MRSWDNSAARRGGPLITALFVAATLAASFLVAARSSSSRLLLLLTAGLGLGLLVQQPALGLVTLAALSFTLPLEIGTGTEVALTPPVLLIPAIVLAWLIDGLRHRALRLPPSRTTLPLLLFVGSGLLSLLAGTATWDPLVPRPGNLLLVQLAQWAIFALSAAIFLVAVDLGHREPWLQVTTFTFLAVGAVVVLHWFVWDLWNILGWAAPANTAMFWAWLAAMATGQLLFNRHLHAISKVGLLALLISGGYTVWVPKSTWVSGWLPFTAAVFAVVWLWAWRRSRALALLAVLSLVVLAVVLYPFLFEHSGGESEYRDSWGGRLLLYRQTLDVVKDHPILGLGPAAYRHYAFTRWLSLGVDRALYLRPLVSSHNNYIDVYAQMGLLGLGLFLWFLWELGRSGWRLKNRFDGDFRDGYVHGALGGLAATLVAMLIVDWFLPFVYNVGFQGFRTSALAWMFLGGLVALEQVDKKAEV